MDNRLLANDRLYHNAAVNVCRNTMPRVMNLYCIYDSKPLLNFHETWFDILAELLNKFPIVVMKSRNC